MDERLRAEVLTALASEGIDESLLLISPGVITVRGAASYVPTLQALRHAGMFHRMSDVVDVTSEGVSDEFCTHIRDPYFGLD